MSEGYGVGAKVLHWGMLLALVAQFAVGYSMERAEGLLGWAVNRLLGGEDDRLLVVHVGLGVAILALAVVRVAWRKVAGLPPWAETLSEGERRFAHRVEQVLYWMMFLIPLTGLALVLISGEDWDLNGGEWVAPLEWIDDDVLLAAHISAHLVFFGGFFAHVGLVLKHQLINRDGLLRRML